MLTLTLTLPTSPTRHSLLKDPRPNRDPSQGSGPNQRPFHCTLWEAPPCGIALSSLQYLSFFHQTVPPRPQALRSALFRRGVKWGKGMGACTEILLKMGSAGSGVVRTIPERLVGPSSLSEETVGNMMASTVSR